MNYVKISLREYDNLKKSHEALRAKKILRVSYSGNEKHPYSYSESYCTESEVIDKLTKRINELETVISKLKAEASMAKVEVKSKSFWDFLKL